ncbi:MAG: helix-turn-helix transcriptional regulator [Frankiaceae bacterium]|jgi:HTH-type transcriptional regulator/antitoxin HipB|nr:helix-turn-helix transcriptional regulator [Frankiaceae bacterium]
MAMRDRFLTTPEAVGQAVREGRKEAGWSQAELAVRAGVGRRFVVDVEAGHPRAELAKVLALLDAVGVHATALPAAPAPMRPQDVNLDEVIARFA